MYNNDEFDESNFCYCELCNEYFTSQAHFNNHTKCKRHKAKLRKIKSKIYDCTHPNVGERY